MKTVCLEQIHKVILLVKMGVVLEGFKTNITKKSCNILDFSGFLT